MCWSRLRGFEISKQGLVLLDPIPMCSSRGFSNNSFCNYLLGLISLGRENFLSFSSLPDLFFSLTALFVCHCIFSFLRHESSIIHFFKKNAHQIVKSMATFTPMYMFPIASLLTFITWVYLLFWFFTVLFFLYSLWWGDIFALTEVGGGSGGFPHPNTEKGHFFESESFL